MARKQTQSIRATREKSSAGEVRSGSDDVAAKLIRDAVALASSTSRRPLRRRLSVRFNEPPEVEMNLKVRFVGSTGDERDKLPEWSTDVRRRGLAAVLEGISEDDASTLRGLEPQLLKWLAKSDENAARFYADPVASLALAGIDIDAALLKRVRRTRRRSSKLASQLPRARIKTIVPGI